jgi:hypothetical protein
MNSPGPLLTFDIPQTALVATFDTYDFRYCILNFTCSIITLLFLGADLLRVN